MFYISAYLDCLYLAVIVYLAAVLALFNAGFQSGIEIKTFGQVNESRALASPLAVGGEICCGGEVCQTGGFSATTSLACTGDV